MVGRTDSRSLRHRNSDELKQANPTISTIYSTIGYFSIYVFGWMLIHEVIRNLDEINGERELECHTMPIVWGEKTAKYIGCGLIVLINIVCGYFLIKEYGVAANNVGQLLCMQHAGILCSTHILSIDRPVTPRLSDMPTASRPVSGGWHLL